MERMGVKYGGVNLERRRVRERPVRGDDGPVSGTSCCSPADS